jgi:hypothetical protein
MKRGGLVCRTLPLTERLTMIPWLFSVLDYESTAETYRRYDEMSALDMFKMYGVSRAMYEGFIKPTLLVALFAPPEVLTPLLLNTKFIAWLDVFSSGAVGPQLVARSVALMVTGAPYKALQAVACTAPQTLVC